MRGFHLVAGAQASLKYSASPHVVATYLAELVATEKLDVVSTTEAQGRGKVRAVRRALGPKWRVRRRGEYLLAHRRRVFRGRGRARLVRLTRVHGDDAWRDLWIAAFPLTHVATGLPAEIEIGHAPAGVESGDEWSTDQPLQVKASKRGYAAWGRRPVEVVHIRALDSNLDQRRPRWRRFTRRMLRLPSVLGKRVMHRGTHGRRLIDTVHTNARDLSARVSKVNPPSPIDHRAVTYRLAISIP